MCVITVEQVNNGVLSQTTRQAFTNDEVVSFCDPLLAIKYCVNNDVQMVICEKSLKRLDGLSFIKLINQKFKNIKAVLVCDDGDIIENITGMEFRCINYPVTVEKLK